MLSLQEGMKIRQQQKQNEGGDWVSVCKKKKHKNYMDNATKSNKTNEDNKKPEVVERRYNQPIKNSLGTTGSQAHTNEPIKRTYNQSNRSQNKSSGNNSSQRKEKLSVITKIKEGVNADAIREALATSDEFPKKLKNALGSASLELNNRGEFIVRSKEGENVNYNVLRSILKKNDLPGWLEWFQGRRGWTIAEGTQKQPYINYHRDLHEAYTVVMRALLKKANPDLKRLLVVLYYKQDPQTQENGGISINGARQNTQTLWKKASEKESLQDAVGKIRPFLEVLRYFCTDPKEKWSTLPWLMPNLTRGDCERRLEQIFRLVFDLMRSSERGPDVPVQWAAHPPLNHYPRSTTTSATMEELVVSLANILSNLFLPDAITVNNLEGVDKILPKFSSCLDEEGGTNKLEKTMDTIEPLSIGISKLCI